MTSTSFQRMWRQASLSVLGPVVESSSGSRVTFWVLQSSPVQHLMLQSIKVQFCNEAKRFLASSQAFCVPKMIKSEKKSKYMYNWICKNVLTEKYHTWIIFTRFVQNLQVDDIIKIRQAGSFLSLHCLLVF